MLLFTCPSCGLQRSVREERMGKPMHCRGCEEVFTLTSENCKPEKLSGKTAVRKKASTTAADEDENEQLTAAIEGALPGATAGVLSGILTGALRGSDPGTAVSWAMVGLVVGVAIGTTLGAAAGVYSQRTQREKTWQRWPAPMLLGALVGLATAALIGGVRELPWGALAGMAAAALWPLLGRLTEEKPHVSTSLLSEDRIDHSQAPAEDTRHYIDPREMNQADQFARRRHAQ